MNHWMLRLGVACVPLVGIVACATGQDEAPVPHDLLDAGADVAAPIDAQPTVDAAPDAPALSCPTGFSACDGVCVDVSADARNCGTCGNACGPTPNGSIACKAGKCVATCNTGLHVCGGKCVYENASSCGTSCAACTAPTNGTAICKAGACGATCTAGFAACGTACCVGPAGTKAIALGRAHTCAVTGASGLKCWGTNFQSQLGDGTKNGSTTPVDVLGLDNGVAGVAAGGDTSCALLASGAVKCWGANDRGQVGGGTSGATIATPTYADGLLSGVVSIAVGEAHACALTNAGAVKCWGANDHGQLGNGANADSNFPVAVQSLASGVVAIAAGGAHTCAITVAGAVKCWGKNDAGQLGNASTTDTNVPADVASLGAIATRLAAGTSHTCALVGGGGIRCWGAGASGQLGNGATAASPIPVAVGTPGTGAAEIFAGGAHTCALFASGAAECWGSNASGELGIGAGGGASSAAPVQVSGLASGTAWLAVGAAHTCARVASGVTCWGANDGGQLGNGGPSSPTPVAVVGL